MKWLYVACMWSMSVTSMAQQAIHRSELWAAYISAVPIDDKFSMWNDIHWVSDAFVLVRHGLTRHFSSRTSLTGGYAWVRTSTPWTNRLLRQEYRPWAQFDTGMAISTNSSYRFRLRYDARFRKRLSSSRVEEDFLFQNRIRLMNSARFKMRTYGKGRYLHFNVLNETLFQFGQGIDGFRVDQNRTFLLPGFTVSQMTFMGGYHLRIVPGASRMTYNHGLTLWIVQRFGV